MVSNNFNSFGNFCDFQKIANIRSIFGAKMVIFQTFRKQKYPSKSIVCVYQGHTNTRTSKFCKEYTEALKNADSSDP